MYIECIYTVYIMYLCYYFQVVICIARFNTRAEPCGESCDIYNRFLFSWSVPTSLTRMQGSLAAFHWALAQWKFLNCLGAYLSSLGKPANFGSTPDTVNERTCLYICLYQLFCQDDYATWDTETVFAETSSQTQMEDWYLLSEALDY